MDDIISKFITGGERAGEFAPSAVVYSEMAVRSIVLAALRHGGCCADCKKRIIDNESRNFMCSLTNARTVAGAICPYYDRDPDVPF